MNEGSERRPSENSRRIDMPAEAMVDAILNDAMAFERINLTVSRRRPFTAFEGKLREGLLQNDKGVSMSF